MSKMKFSLLLILYCFINLSDAKILRLNDSEYARMPPMFHLDDYTSCTENGFLFCYVDLKLAPHTNYELYNLIQQYSLYPNRTYDHKEVHYGICVNETCKKNIQNDLRGTLEECLNEPLRENYGLQGKVINEIHCNNNDYYRKIDNVDIFVAIIFIAIVTLNVIGSILTQSVEKTGKGFLDCFSLKQNWKLLTAPSLETKPGKIHLKCVDGFRSITALSILGFHTFVVFVFIVKNSHEIEKVYDSEISAAGINLVLIVHMFFVLSGFLLVYNTEPEEGTQLPWTELPKRFILRYLRLTIPFGIMLLFMMTWVRFLGSGPLWQKTIVQESAACREEWMYNILYLHNYLHHAQCMLQTWYLATDIQLYTLCLAIIVLIRNPFKRTIVLGVLFLIAFIPPALHTYFQDLDAMLICSLETHRNFFYWNLVMNYVYKRGYNNMGGFIIGVAVGYLVLYIKKTNYKFPMIFRLFYWLTMPGFFYVAWLSRIFYIEEERSSRLYRAVFAGLVKPTISIFLGVSLLGSIFQVDKFYRLVFERDIWTYFGRLSYLVYMIHCELIRFYVGTSTTTVYYSEFNYALFIVGNATVSVLIAIPMWLLVESPFNRLVKLYLDNNGKQLKKQ